MEKLELKNLVGYLPYGLKIKIKQDFYPKLEGIGLLTTKNIYHFGFPKRQIIPFLRPLSDLTKEIEVNGEKFVPLEELNKDAITKYRIEIINSKIYLLADFNKGYNVLSRNNPKNKLLEWHFDIFNLIENNLAIDINTLNQ